MIVSEHQYWRVDQTFLVKDDSFHKGLPNSEPYKMRKVIHYNCNVAFHEKASFQIGWASAHCKMIEH